MIFSKPQNQSLSLAELRMLEEILFILLVVGIILYRLSLTSSFRNVTVPFTIATTALFLVVGGWFMDRAISLDEQHAILLVDEAEVRSAPIPGASTLFVIHEGTSAEILDATDAWYELRLEDGKTGWILHEAVGLY